MPKVIKSGIFAPENEIPDKPSPGLKVRHGYCKAILEVQAEENCYSLVIRRKKRMIFIGWEFKCPECGRKVFISYTKPIPEIYFEGEIDCKEIIENNLEDWVTEMLN